MAFCGSLLCCLVAAQAEKQRAGWEGKLKEGQHWSEIAGEGKGGFRLWA